MKIYVIEVQMTDTEWKRVGRYYRDKVVVKSWVSFVSAAWNRKARIATVEKEESK